MLRGEARLTGSTDWRGLLLKDAPDVEVANQVITAVQRLFERDAHLLISRLHERTITGILACHLRQCFPGWDVDPEYNRVGPAVKKSDGRIVIPDIIIHHRGTQENRLVIEVKKSTTHTPDSKDIGKLDDYLAFLQYQIGLFLKLTVGEGAPGVSKVKWVKGVDRIAE